MEGEIEALKARLQKSLNAHSQQNSLGSFGVKCPCNAPPPRPPVSGNKSCESECHSLHAYHKKYGVKTANKCAFHRFFHYAKFS